MIACPVGQTVRQIGHVMTKPTEDLHAFAAELPASGTLLGLDLGTKTIGLAISDRTRLIASPLETLRRVKQTLDIEHIRAVVAKHAVAGFVLGFPINMDGSKGPRTQSTGGFARALLAAIPLPLLLWDERLSTVAAERAMLEADTSRAKRALSIDKVAAGIILQGALDRMRNIT